MVYSQMVTYLNTTPARHSNFVDVHNAITTTRGGQKVLSLATFRYTFGWENVTAFNNGFLLVFFENFMASVCLLFDI